MTLRGAVITSDTLGMDPLTSPDQLRNWNPGCVETEMFTGDCASKNKSGDAGCVFQITPFPGSELARNWYCSL